MKEMAVYERNGGENSQIRQSGAEDREKEGKKILRTLFWTDFYISAFTFGGGFVIITLMKKKFVNELHWIDEKEMLDFAAMAQSSPGAIAVNAAILVGWKLKKLSGMAAAVLGAILPPMLILDEATSSIDTRTELKIQNAFVKMMEGRTSFIVAHRLSTIKEADLILVMRDGQIIEQGTHESLLERNGFYAELYNSQWAV